MFRKQAKADLYLYIRETKHGLVTFVSDDINLLNLAYREQLKTFLEEIIKRLGSENKPPVYKKDG